MPLMIIPDHRRDLTADRRWVARGGKSGAITDIAIWAVPAGIIGARLYHVPDRLVDVLLGPTARGSSLP